MPTRSFARVISIYARDIERRRRANLARRAGLFESGAESAERFGSPWGSVYRAGPNPEPFGRRLSETRILPPGPLRAALDDPGFWVRSTSARGRSRSRSRAGSWKGCRVRGGRSPRR